MDMSVFTTNVASMVGIGVAVDYSLFILARYREEIRAGATPEDARRTAMRTSGVAVVFSGLTVMISLAGLFLVDSTTIRSMALGAIVVVAVSILAAVTFLPAVMRAMGRRAYMRGRPAMVVALIGRNLRWRKRRRGSTDPEAQRAGFWQRWTDRVTRRPVVSALASAGVLLVLAIPALSLEFGDGALRQFPEGNETRVGAELAAKELGPGASEPDPARGDLRRGHRLRRRATAARWRAGARTCARPRGGAGRPPAALRGRARGTAHGGAQERLREPGGARDDGPAAARRPGSIATVADVQVGGATAAVEDFKDLVAGSMWKIALFVLAFSYLVLFVLLRSVLLPLKAVVMNMLTVAAAYGVLVAIFQYGWLDGFLGFESLGYINTITPPFLLAIVFGLSMDYEVFLLSRIRERYDATGDTKTAVAQGLAQERRHHLQRRADHGRRLRGLRRHRRALDQGDRRGPGGGDLPRRHAGAAGAGARDHGDHGRVELVAA